MFDERQIGRFIKIWAKICLIFNCILAAAVFIFACVVDDKALSLSSVNSVEVLYVRSLYIFPSALVIIFIIIGGIIQSALLFAYGTLVDKSVEQADGLRILNQQITYIRKGEESNGFCYTKNKTD